MRELEGRTAPGRRALYLAGPKKAVAFSHDGTRLAATFEDNTVKIWDAKSGQLIHWLKGHRTPVNNVAYSPDGRWLATAGVNLSRRADAGELLVWDAATGQRAAAIAVDAVTGAIAFGPDSLTLAACSDARVGIWEVSSGRPLRTLSGHAMASALSFVPGSHSMATAGLDPPLHLWNLDVDRDAIIPAIPRGNALVRVEIDPSGRRIAAVDGGESVLAWADGPIGQPRLFPGASFAFPAAPGAIAVAGEDGHIRTVKTSPRA